MLDVIGRVCLVRDSVDLGFEVDNFVEDYFVYFIDIIDDFEVKVESGWVVGFVISVVLDGKIGVFEGFFDIDVVRGVESKYMV